MKLGFVVNALSEMTPSQTTSMLAHRAAALGHEVHVWAADGFALEPDGRVRVVAHALDALGSAPRPLDASALDAVLLRVNPGRETRPRVVETMLDFARILKDAGVLVLNDPDGLARASNKLYLRKVPPAFRPVTLVSRERAAIRTFVEAQPEGAVLKPLVGTRGQDVFLVRAGEGASNLNQIVDVLTRGGGYAMVQSFVPEAVDGDVRLIVLDGRLLEVDGVGVAVRRVPAPDDFRSNVHVGGHAAPATVTDTMRACVEAVGPTLASDGLFLAGIDFIGGKVVEINVFATGGLHDAEAYYERDYTGAILRAVEAALAARR